MTTTCYNCSTTVGVHPEEELCLDCAKYLCKHGEDRPVSSGWTDQDIKLAEADYERYHKEMYERLDAMPF